MKKLAIMVATATMLTSPLAYALGDSTNTNTNTNAATGGAATNTNTGTSTNTITVTPGGGGAGGTGGNASQHQTQGQGQNQSVTKSGNSSNSYVSEAQKRNPVASAASNFLAASGDCIGSAGLSGQFIGFGGGLATTTSAPDCNRRADAAYWHKAGKPVIAMARMCQDDNNRKAVHDAGEFCPDEGAVKYSKGMAYIEPTPGKNYASANTNPHAYVADARWPSTRGH